MNEKFEYEWETLYVKNIEIMNKRNGLVQGEETNGGLTSYVLMEALQKNCEWKIKYIFIVKI